MLKKIMWMFTAACLVVCPGLASAGETDLLVQKLVEKGILTPYEAQILRDDIRQDVNKQIAEKKNDALPSWVQSIKMKGDARLRYQSTSKEGTGNTVIRNRGRVRYRLGIEGKPNDKFTVGAGLASGGQDPRSTNHTLEDSHEKSYAMLDYAFAEYKPTSWLTMIGGRYNAASRGFLWYTTDMMWDSDINQGGLSARLDIPKVLFGDMFITGGYWALDESSTSQSDAGMYYAQMGMKFQPAEGWNMKVAGTGYGTHFGGAYTSLPWRTDVEGTAPTSPDGNSMTGSTYKYKFTPVYAGSAEIVYSWPEETSFPIKMAGIFGDYVSNPDPSSHNTGWASGVKFGHKKVGEARGDWQFKYQYVSLGADAWLDAFPDSDRYSGATNSKGNEFILAIGLAKNVTLDLDYYMTDRIAGGSKEERLFQADINFKF
ncbi:MAG: putative porin [Candidatus Omnitrophica bacterium]|nr:putative porin [Candidatus Omnitrophota bacterium]